MVAELEQHGQHTCAQPAASLTWSGKQIHVHNDISTSTMIDDQFPPDSLHPDSLPCIARYHAVSLSTVESRAWRWVARTFAVGSTKTFLVEIQSIFHGASAVALSRTTIVLTCGKAVRLSGHSLF